MKIKLSLVISLILIVHVRAAVETNVAAQDMDLVLRMIKASRSTHPLTIGNEPVLLMEPIQAPAVLDLFPDHKVYRLVSSRDLAHRAKVSALLIDTNGSPTHLQTDEHVAFFIGHKSRDVRSKEDALKLVRAFADLRAYKIVESPPQVPDARPLEKQPARKPTDYKFVAEDLKGRWLVYATFMTSEYSGRHERYILEISKMPGSGIALEPPVMIHLRNYVF